MKHIIIALFFINHKIIHNFNLSIAKDIKMDELLEILSTIAVMIIIICFPALIYYVCKWSVSVWQFLTDTSYYPTTDYGTTVYDTTTIKPKVDDKTYNTGVGTVFGRWKLPPVAVKKAQFFGLLGGQEVSAEEEEDKNSLFTTVYSWESKNYKPAAKAPHFTAKKYNYNDTLAEKEQKLFNDDDTGSIFNKK